MFTELAERMIFRCAGSRKDGLGHLARCRVLARHLAREFCLFAVRPDPVAQKYLADNALPFRVLPEAESDREEAGRLADYALKFEARTVVLDKKDNTALYVGWLKSAGLCVVDFEDLGAGRTQADFLIDPHLTADPPEINHPAPLYSGFGPEWAILHPLFARLHSRAGVPVSRVRGGAITNDILIACGGSDPASLAGRILKLLDRWDETFRITVVSGPGVHECRYPECRRHTVRVVRSPAGLSRLLYRSRMAFVSGGITMLESLCLGVPTVVVPQHEEQYRNAARLAAQGSLLLTPPADDPAFGIGFEVAARALFKDEILQAQLARKGWEMVDGGGLDRLRKALTVLPSLVSCC